MATPAGSMVGKIGPAAAGAGRFTGACILAAGWLLFVVSFFLPATDVLQRAGTPAGAPLVGWQAARAAWVALAAQPLVFLVEPRALLFLLAPLANLIALLSPLLAIGAPQRAGGLAIVFLLAALAALSLPKTLTGNLFIGFYVWVGSFALLSAGCAWIGRNAPRPWDEE